MYILTSRQTRTGRASASPSSAPEPAGCRGALAAAVGFRQSPQLQQTLQTEPAPQSPGTFDHLCSLFEMDFTTYGLDQLLYFPN